MADILEFYTAEELEFIYKIRRLNINPEEFVKSLLSKPFMTEDQQDDNYMDDYPGLNCSNCGEQIILGVINNSNERNKVLCRTCNIISRKK